MNIFVVAISYNLSVSQKGRKVYAEVFTTFKEAFDYAKDEIFDLQDKGIEVDYREVINDELKEREHNLSFLVQELNGTDFIQVTIRPKRYR
ncbi:hypothetical protein LQK80_01070 [Bacillus thuringiensis]|nr:hypothetical protein [Bacillus thuringiensis]